MNNIKVTLLHHTPLYISADGARTCWASQDKSDTCLILVCDSCGTKSIDSEEGIINFEMNIGDDNQHECHNCKSMKNHWEKYIGPKDLALIDRVGNQFHHASILEHISMNFFIDGISRACLQEIVRHRVSSFSVKSSRYTLTELKRLSPFIDELGHLYVNGNGEYINKDGILASDYLVQRSNDKVNKQNVRTLDALRDILSDGISNDEAKYCLPEAYRTQLTWSINLRSLQNFLSLRTDRKALPEIQHLAHLIYEALPTDAQSLVAHCVSSEIEKQKTIAETNLARCQQIMDEDQ